MATPVTTQVKIQVSTQEKREILHQIENKSTQESQRIMAKNLDLPVIAKTRTKIQGDESVRLEVTLTKEEWVELKRCQELLGHKNYNGSLGGVIQEVCRHYRSNKDPIIQKIRGKDQGKDGGKGKEKEKEKKRKEKRRKRKE